MVNKIVVISLGAIVALAPLAATAQTVQLAQAAPAATDTNANPPATTGTHRAMTRHRHNMSHHRSRASAEHMRKMNSTPAAPATPAPQ
jgi:hypothetical protein